MMIAQSKTYLPYIQAAAEGKTIQHNNDNVGWKDLPAVATIECYSPESLRIKPEPKLRPWKPEEVPFDAIFKWTLYENGPFRILRMEREDCFILNTEGHIIHHPCSYFLNNAVYSTDGGKTWHPCGILE